MQTQALGANLSDNAHLAHEIFAHLRKMEYSDIIGKYSNYFPAIRTHFLHSFMNQVIFFFVA